MLLIILLEPNPPATLLPSQEQSEKVVREQRLERTRNFLEKKKQNAALKCPNRVPGVQVKKDLGTPCPPLSFPHQLFISLSTTTTTTGATHPRHDHAHPRAHRHTFFFSKSVHLNPCVFFSYQAVDIHAGLQQRLDGAVVSVPCRQVKRGVPATVAGHEVGVSVYQHAHHLDTRGRRLTMRLYYYFARFLRFGSRRSTLMRREAAESFDCARNNSAQQVSSSITASSYACVHLVNLCSVSVTRECSGSFHRRDFPSLQCRSGERRKKKKTELFIRAQTNLDGSTAITRCLSRAFLFERRDDLKYVYFMKDRIYS